MLDRRYNWKLLEYTHVERPAALHEFRWDDDREDFGQRPAPSVATRRSTRIACSSAYAHRTPGVKRASAHPRDAGPLD